MNTAMFDLQTIAAAVAAGGGLTGSSAGTGDVPEGGMSFSDVLASQTSQTVQTSQTSQDMQTQQAGQTEQTALTEQAASAADSTDGLTENVSDGQAAEVVGGAFGEVIKYIENADDGVKKALKMLLERVLKAMRDPDDGKERKTDMFTIISDLGADPVEEGDFLLGAKIMDKFGFMIKQTEKSTDKTDVFAELEEIVSCILGVKDDDDTDENTAADALAAMLNVQPEEMEDISFWTEDAKAEAIENAAEAFKAPMQAIEEKLPEQLPKAEKLYAEFEAVMNGERENFPETNTAAGFAALRISNASEQISSISAKAVRVTFTDNAEAIEANVPEIDGDETQSVKTENTEAYGVEDKTFAEAIRIQPQAQEETKDAPETENASETKIKGVSDDAESTAISAALNAEPERLEIRETAPESEDIPETDKAAPAERQIAEAVDSEIRSFGDKDGTKELVLILRPKELGQVAVKLVKENGAVSVLLSAQYEEVGKLMTQRAAYLGSSLSNQDYNVKDVQVVEPGNAAEQMGLNFTDGGFSFARNSYSNERNSESGGYEQIDGIDGIDETIADIGEIRSREARLWTTA